MISGDFLSFRGFAAVPPFHDSTSAVQPFIYLSAFNVATARSLGISSRTTWRAYREVGADLQSSEELREPLVDFILLLMLQKQIVLSTG